MTSILGNTRRPDIKFHHSGQIDISATISKQLSLHKGDVIDICVHNGEYYLVVRCRGDRVIGRHEGQCYPTNSNKTCNNYRAYSKRLCNAILQVVGSNIAKLPSGLAEHLEPYGSAVPLITRNNIL